MTPLVLLATGLILSLLAVLTGIWKTPFGFSSFPVWIILAINGAVALTGALMLILASRSAA
ncbi:MAG: hypothetical protein ACYCW9_00140 [Thermoplasmata archaeon]